MSHGLGYYLAHLISQWQHYFDGMNKVELIWLMVGLLGQSMFMMRFVVQWIHSERHQKSVIPVSFWYLSLSGGLIVLAYGIHKVEPVIILGQLPGTFVYIRNLMLIRREKESSI
ncbi:lipid-A-disaccharide synthase N-terminal domain-containing protein [Hydrogenophaga sp.]|uniref:lipid-A-disaccharide synthase N-terminal domain-containing protein n=1 Tax=Hydrogenophaga sp. TaxID=1904254 RepID=UPI000BDD8C67|nr:lipid-A-disaccharide synthase N-terminal domain-containing protein [Hydrogenophaga sp.]MDP1958987.1 lipid-A-disaccharide synthase N-terminal domain-containing protein [Methylotenera sp.]OYY02442.1 MAG: lipid-A-disaccharide synthase [Mehylophilales bacterium 35-46-6]OYZ39225.1 MAG: lipid-A-disaccharide synthase [Methylotenera sp. 24-45-7]MDP3885455.1 lipid-A-disaccharide synthase N-terminal domain-containing protein [Hydrogenophaga sp.]HQS37789.1 lipid-A-disaccharide synthase N-terminal doma